MNCRLSGSPVTLGECVRIRGQESYFFFFSLSLFFLFSVLYVSWGFEIPVAGILFLVSVPTHLVGQVPVGTSWYQGGSYGWKLPSMLQ